MAIRKELLSVLLVIAIFLSAFGYVPVTKAVNATITNNGEVALSTVTIEDDFADNRVLVLLSKDASKRISAYSITNFSEIRAIKVESLTAEMYEHLAQKTDTNANKERMESFKHVLSIELAEPGKENVLNAIKTLEGREDILYAGPDYVIRTQSTPNDTYVNNQWSINNTDLDDAWNLTTGSSSVLVGVLDSGIDTSHEDLVNVVNSTLSKDFTGLGGATTDVWGHGTKVAGVIGAKGDNNKGISGVCWNVKLVSLKVIGNNGLGYSSYAYSAISYAATKNIPILNLSFSWSEDEAGGRYNQVLDTMIANYPGLVVCSAGNENNNNDSHGYYPSNCRLSNLISVGASTQNNGRWVYTATKGSNYGSWSVDVFAPGENIQTISSQYGYFTDSGTSYAAPFVAGIAALILSQHPSILEAESPGVLLKNIIMGSVDTFSAFSGKCVTGGRVNAYKAVTSDLAHTYTLSRDSLMYHKYTCIDCGDRYYEMHNWNDAGTACEDCGFYPMGDV